MRARVSTMQTAHAGLGSDVPARSRRGERDEQFGIRVVVQGEKRRGSGGEGRHFVQAASGRYLARSTRGLLGAGAFLRPTTRNAERRARKASAPHQVFPWALRRAHIVREAAGIPRRARACVGCRPPYLRQVAVEGVVKKDCRSAPLAASFQVVRIPFGDA